LGNGVPPNDTRTRGNGDTVAFSKYRRAKNCKVYGKFIFKKIIEIVAIRCHILKLKRTKFDFCWGSATDPAGRAGGYSATPDPLAGFKGPIYF